MSLAAQLNSSTVLTPRERERQKSAQQRAEDVIYTLNHTFTCLTLTDLLIVPVLRGLGMNIGHGHGPEPKAESAPIPASPSSGGSSAPLSDAELKTLKTPQDVINAAKKNGGIKKLGFSELIEQGASKEVPQEAVRYTDHCGVPGHPSGAHSHLEMSGGSGSAVAKDSLWQRIWGEIRHAFGHFSWRGARNWFVGEAIGDVGAAFVTIPVQRFFPGVMEGVRHAIEPMVGGFFRRGARHAANKWADRHGIARDGDEVVARAQELYDYEMRHLPQMAMWTLSSIGLHFGVMRALEKEMTVGQFARQKAATSAITAGLVFGARALAPDKAHKWDETAGRHVVVPLTKSVGKLFGVKERDVDEYHARKNGDEAPKSWAARIEKPAEVTAEAVRS